MWCYLLLEFKFCFRTLQGHGHWVNVLALNTDYVMRTGAFDPAKATIVHDDNGKFNIILIRFFVSTS